MESIDLMAHLRTKARRHWCKGRPPNEHVMSYRERAHRGDIWMCDDCKQVWIAVQRPSLLDGVPHWAIKWKRMCSLRARRWQKKGGQS